MLLSAVNQAVEERAGSDDDGLGADGAAIAEADAEGSLALAVFGKMVVGRWSLRFAQGSLRTVVGESAFVVALLVGGIRFIACCGASLNAPS